MNDVLPIELPLQDVYAGLVLLEQREPHKYADTDSYLTLVGILRKGYCLQSREDLYFLCEKLWLKPFHDNNAQINAGVLRKLIDEALEKYEVLGTGSSGTADSSGAADSGDGAASADRDSAGGSSADGGSADGAEGGFGDRGSGDEAGGDGSKAGDAGEGMPGEETLFLRIDDQPLMAERPGATIGKELEDKLLFRNYIVKGIYLPVSTRRIEQTIRSYRYRGKEGTARAIDMEATLMNIARKGYFDTYATKKELLFTTDWTLLIDHEGSMVAFHQLSNEIARVATQQSLDNAGDIFYFKNCPVNYLYRDAAHTVAESFPAFAAGHRRNILVISDAGAARSTYNEQRIRATYQVLYQLRQHKIAWLNPLPRKRWKNTSAGMIAKKVDMFEIGDGNTDDLGNIVKLFKTKINRSNL